MLKWPALHAFVNYLGMPTTTLLIVLVQFWDHSKTNTLVIFLSVYLSYLWNIKIKLYHITFKGGIFFRGYFSVRSCPCELPQAEGYIWLYIPCLVIIRMHYKHGKTSDWFLAHRLPQLQSLVDQVCASSPCHPQIIKKISIAPDWIFKRFLRLYCISSLSYSS